MVVISKSECEAIRKLYPEISHEIKRTCKLKGNGAKRGKIYVPEYQYIVEWLKKERNTDTIV